MSAFDALADLALLDEVSKLVESWGPSNPLQVTPGSSWTTDDSLTALKWLAPTDEVELRLSFDHGEYTVSQRGYWNNFCCGSLDEALLRLLHDRLSRTCPECRQLDGHDVRCKVGLAGDTA